jgi:hypothetical protein
MWPFSLFGTEERVLEAWGPQWVTFSIEGKGQRKDADIALAQVLESAARSLDFPVFIVRHRPSGLALHDGWYHGTVAVRVFWPVNKSIDPMLAARYETGSVQEYIQYLTPFMARNVTQPRAVSGLQEFFWWGGRDKHAKVRCVNANRRPA